MWQGKGRELGQGFSFQKARDTLGGHEKNRRKIKHCHPEPRRRRGTSQPQMRSPKSAPAINADRRNEPDQTDLSDSAPPERSLAVFAARDDRPHIVIVLCSCL